MFIDLKSGRHHYVSRGEGPPVVMVHGLGGSLHLWYAAMESLALHHHVVALDLRGSGRSEQGHGGYTVQSWVSDVAELIGALELPAVTLVGHSLGTLIAQQAALDHPDTVDNLVLVGGISWFEPPTKEQYLKRAEVVEAEGPDAIVDDWLLGAIAPRNRAANAPLVGLLRDLFLRNDPGSYAKACRAMANAPSIQREEIGQPTLLVVGDHDCSAPIAMTEELHREIPVSRVRVIANAAHWLPLEQPDELAAAILEFLT